MTKISIEKANIIIDGAFAKARELGTKPMAATVLDDGGHLVAYKREDGATHLRFDISRGKAWGSIALGMNSRKYAEMAQDRPTFVTALDTMTEGKIVPSAGGVLIKDGDEVIGAVGVSGDLPDLDEECAMAGIDSA
jgi:uncharacterized protein GlcG (DUF336 family)